ncbi:nucleotidyl transferase AbiEii/AbiGii toxin family protein [Mesorhizobium sp. M1006]
MMIQIGHRESHDIDIFLEDPQLLGFIDPSKSRLRFDLVPSDYQGDGLRFQKFAFEGIGEIDFIVAGALTTTPFETCVVEGRTVRLETIPEIIAKKVYYRGSEAKPRDIFDIAAAARSQLGEVVNALRTLPEHVARTRERMEKLNPEFVGRAIAQLMIMPATKRRRPTLWSQRSLCSTRCCHHLKEPDRLTLGIDRGRAGLFKARKPW